MDQIIRMFGVNRRSNLGFTLIELLIVIAIIGIIAGISIPMFMGQRTKAIISECHTNLQTLYVLQEQYYAEYGRYAPWINKSNPDEQGRVAKYHTADTSISTYFPQFRPGPASDLNFFYLLISTANGQGFDAKCRGYPNTQHSSLRFILTQENDLSTW